MGNLLCRHCFHLFPERETAVLCTARACSSIPDERGRPGPRFLVPSRVPGLWSRWKRRPDLAAPCPVCREVGRLVPACPLCRKPLPRAFEGEREADDRIIAVIGAKDSGKSHYLATLFHQFLRAGVGGDRWRVDVDEPSRREIERRYWRPLFDEMRELEESPLEPGPEVRLALESRDDGRRVLLAFRDLSGETFSQPARLDEVGFLRYAHGVVLLADPGAFGALPASADDPDAGHPDFLDVLAAYRRSLDGKPRFGDRAEELLPLLPEQKLLAVAVSKADLVLPRRHPFWRRADSNGHLDPGFWEGRSEASGRARSWLAERLGGRLDEAALGFADVSYFFISSFGYKHTPHTETLRKPPEPLRVHEPIFALLDRFAAGSAARRGGPAEAPPVELEEL